MRPITHRLASIYTLNMKTAGLNVVCVGELQNNLKMLHEEWKQLGANQKAPYERAAAADADRYRREVKPGFHSNAIACEIFTQQTQVPASNRMLGRSSGNHDWLLANASACVSCGFRLRNARNASDCV